MIRFAALSDRDRIVALLKASRDAAGFDRASGFCFPYDAAYAVRLFAGHIARADALCIVYVPEEIPQGVLMAIAHEHPFGAVKIARETVWWVDPAHRGSAAMRMLDAYEAWAHAQGCRFVGMVGMGEDPDVGKLYRRRGYTAAELHFLKAI